MDFPRFIVVEIQHPTPYYDDSYAVNSASQGPYGDAINYELTSLLEERFQGLGRGGLALPMVGRPAVGKRWPRKSSIPSYLMALSSPAPIPSIFVPTPHHEYL